MYSIKKIVFTSSFLFVCHFAVAQKDSPKLIGSKNSYKYVEQMPKPKYNVYRYLRKSIKYPPELLGKNIGGEVVVSLVVDERGYITDVKSISPEQNVLFQRAAVNAVKSLPRWKKPGSQNGTPVKVYYTLPITFGPDNSKPKK